MAVVDVYGLTPVQSGILFHALESPVDPYLNRLRFRIEGPLDVARFEEAWRWVIARHDVLRTSFHWDDADVPLQAVHDQVDWAIGIPPTADLTQAPLMWLELDGAEATWTHHHLILDGWSLAAVFNEVMQRYRLGEQFDPPLPAPFREHVSWLHSQDPDPQWWHDYLAGVRPTRLRVPMSHVDDWQRLTRNVPVPQGPTPGVAVQAAWAQVLGECCDSDDVVFGTIVSGRSAEVPGVADMVGMFINTVPVRVDLTRPDIARHIFEIQAQRAEFEHVATPPGLFDTLLVIENFPLGETVDTGLRIVPLAAEEHTNYPLTVTVIPRGEHLTVEADFRGIDSSTVSTMLDRFAYFLCGSPAVVSESGSLTYAQLEEAAARVAGWLEGKRRVGVRLGRSTEYAAALLGAVRAGIPYVPCDPATPAQRVAHMFATVDATLDDSTIAEALAHAPVAARPSAPSAPFYTIFTSGSTGMPKGVTVPHSAVAAHTDAIIRTYELTAADRVLHFSSPAFDVATEELFPVWAAHATVVMYPQRLPESVAEFVSFLDTHRVTVVNLPAAYWHLWVDELTRVPLPSTLRLLIVGNEAVWPQQVDRWRAHAPQVRLLNAYGVTEATITTTLYEPSGAAPATVPIGQPLPGMDVQLLNSRGVPVPPGVIGELYIGGSGVATGYLGDPAQTAARFLPAPDGKRLYRTGDLGYVANGQLVLTGRADDQVQIRGHRVEPGEVEAVLSRYAARAVVLVHSGRLVAYVVEPSAAREQACAGLPSYLRPSDWIVLPELPLLPNGKVDRAALPVPHAQGTGAPAATATEQWLADTWTDVLGVSAPGRDDDFFDLGGDSLKATQVAARARRAFGVALPLRSVLERTTLASAARAIDALRRSDVEPLTPLGLDDDRPLSYTQERLWFLHHLEGGENYNIPAAWRLTGALDVAALERALTEIVARHAILRTVFPEVDGQPVSKVLPPAPIRLSAQPWDGPMDLANGPLIQCRLFKQDEDSHLLVVNVHHIVFDGWSHTLFLHELTELYQGRALPTVSGLDYADFAAWQRKQGLDKLVGYWVDHLAGAPQQLALPSDRPRTGRYEGGSHQFTVDALPGLRAVARDGDATLFVVLLAAFNALLHRYSGERDLIVGTPVAGRLLPETEQMIGCFFNTLALRTTVDPQATLRDLVEAVREVAYGGYDHQEAPFEKVVEAVTTGRALDRHPLVQVVLVLQNMAYQPLQLPGLAVETVALPEPAKLDLIVTLAEQDGVLAGNFEYNAALFDAATMAAMADAFAMLLHELARDPDQTVSAVPLAAEPVVARIVAGEETLVDLFDQRVCETPDGLAVVGENGSLTWSQLDRRSAAVTLRLREQGVLPGDAVGLMVDHGVELTVAIWGILRAGAAYVPLEADDPRLAQICADAEVRVTVSHVDESEASLAPQRHHPDQRAYVLFTSGSTGRPKGVAVAHRNVVAFLRWLAADVGLGVGDRWLGHIRPGFDFSVPELLGAVLWGGATVMVREELKTDPSYLVQHATRHGVTAISGTATMLQLIAEQGTLPNVDGLRLIIAGGEAVPMTLLRTLRSQTKARLDGQYGPTETIVHVAAWTMPPADEPQMAIAPIGQPITGSHVQIFDAAQRPVPSGAIGELCIGGVQVSWGYAGSPALTAAKFVPDPWRPGARLYRTGDLGRWHGGGWLEFLGRADRQIKWHGLRIEPGEIEAALLAHPSVKQAVVLAAEDRLIAFVVLIGGELGVSERLQDSPDQGALREHVAGLVPRHMVPAVIVGVAAIPRNANGKTDHAALRLLIPAAAATTTSYEAPQPGTEQDVAGLFGEVLGVRIGRHDDFFLAGGHSLLAVRVMARIRRDFGVALPLRALFEAPTVASMATRVESELLAGADAELLEKLLGAMEATP